MLIKYLGTGDSPRSFIEPLQRYVSVGEIVRVKNSIAAGLLAGGRWRRVSEVPAKSTSSLSGRSPARKRSHRTTAKSSAAATTPDAIPSSSSDPEQPSNNNKVIP